MNSREREKISEVWKLLEDWMERILEKKRGDKGIRKALESEKVVSGQGKDQRKNRKLGFQEAGGSVSEWLKSIRLLPVLFVAVFIISAVVGIHLTSASFSDQETSTGNVLQAGTWDTGTQSEDLKVDLSQAKLTGNGEKLNQIFLENTGDGEITINKLEVAWDKSGNVEWVHLKGPPWNSSKGSPAEIPLDVSLSKTEGPKNLQIRFNSNMTGAKINLSFLMSDGSKEDYQVEPHNPTPIDNPGNGGPQTVILVVNWSEGSVILHQIEAQVDVSSTKASYVEGAEFFLNEPGESGAGYKMEPVRNYSSNVKVTWNSSSGLECEEPCTIFLHGKDSEGNWGEFDSQTIGEEPANRTRDRGNQTSNETGSLSGGGTGITSEGNLSSEGREDLNETGSNESTQDNQTTQTLVNESSGNTTSNQTESLETNLSGNFSGENVTGNESDTIETSGKESVNGSEDLSSGNTSSGNHSEENSISDSNQSQDIDETSGEVNETSTDGSENLTGDNQTEDPANETQGDQTLGSTSEEEDNLTKNSSAGSQPENETNAGTSDLDDGSSSQTSSGGDNETSDSLDASTEENQSGTDQGELETNLTQANETRG